MRLLILLAVAAYVSGYAEARRASIMHKSMPVLPLGLWRSLNDADHPVALTALQTEYPAHTLEVPIDHFSSNDSSSPVFNQTFPLRYWYDATYYKPGGPVFCLDGGETSGADRLSFLSHGILRILSEATNGLSVVLEHRYYGESFPVKNLSTDSLRFLTTQQALADNAYFTQHAIFPDMGPKRTEAIKDAPWIHYGGSYAGAKVALLRKLYPETVFGAIASSAVTAAITDYWKYFESIRLHAPQDCVQAIIQSVSLVDEILARTSKEETQKIKNLFGLANLTHIQDVVALMTYPLGAWQAKNWDPDVSSTGFEDFCEELLGGTSARAEPHQAQKPLFGFSIGGTPSAYLANYARYTRENVVALCRSGQSQDECFGTFDPEAYQRDTLKETWRSWTWQYCAEWGFLQNAPPAGVPSLISRQIDLNYTHQICRLAFPDGEHAKVPAWPNTTLINQYGGFELAEDRIAFIDGSFDPWIYATPHSPDVKQRESTLSRPFELIKGGVHHWDENGLKSSGTLKNEPDEIRRVHQREIDFVKSWLEDRK